MPLQITPASSPAGGLVPASEQAGVPLRPSENVRGTLEVDLDARLRFGDGLILITDQRLIARFPDETAR